MGVGLLKQSVHMRNARKMIQKLRGRIVTEVETH